MKDLIDNMPAEVARVWARQMCARGGKIYCGMEEYKFIQKTIEKYPEYFPQETIYNKIPKEVHEQYEEELEKTRERVLPRPEGELKIIEGEGLVGHIERWSKHQTELAKNRKPIDLDEMFMSWDERDKQKLRFEAEKKKIWKKYYGRYNLKYEE